MSEMKILVPTVIPIDLEPVDGATRVDYDVDAPIPPEHRDAEAIVVWLNPQARLDALPDELPQLRWVQGLMAGTDAVHGAGFGPQVVITAGIGLHDQPVAEHTLALMLAAARRLDQTAQAQADGRWLSAAHRQPDGEPDRLHHPGRGARGHLGLRRDRADAGRLPQRAGCRRRRRRSPRR